MSAMLKGLDLSYVQKTTPPLDAFDFVVVKASQADFADPMWMTHSAAVRKAGLPLLAYHYLIPGSNVPITTQVMRFLATARAADYLFLDEEGAATDVEATLFLNLIRKYRECGLYHSSCGFGGTTEDAQWVADYRNPGLIGPQKCDLSGLFPGWDIWQYTSKGSVAGYAGDLDLDYMNPASPLVARLRVGYRDPATLQGTIDRLQSEGDALRADVVAKKATIDEQAFTIAALKTDLSEAPFIERDRIAAAEAARINAL
jgi:hypothetical protein